MTDTSFLIRMNPSFSFQAATLALESQFPFIKFVSAESMVSDSEARKVEALLKVFDDAYKVSHM